MGIFKNFTIRAVLLALLGLFCLLWCGVGLFSVYALNALGKGNEVDRQLVNQMTVLSKGNDQYFRVGAKASVLIAVPPARQSAQKPLPPLSRRSAA